MSDTNSNLSGIFHSPAVLCAYEAVIKTLALADLMAK